MYWQDDVTALDLPTIKAWALIVRLAVAEYLGLGPAPTSAYNNEDNDKYTGRRMRSVSELVSQSLVPPSLPP